MSDQAQATTSSTHRRVCNMRKRYSNIAAVASTMVQDDECGHRKSFALDLERIPSFHRLNRDGLFEQCVVEEEPQQPQAPRTPTRPSNRRRSKSSAPRKSRKQKSSICQIQETKVVVERVSRQDDDALFQDESSKSLHTDTTASTSTHSSLEFSDDPFFRTTNHRSCTALLFEFDTDFDDDSFFNNNNTAQQQQQKIPSSSSKYSNLGTRMKERAVVPKEDNAPFATPARTPSDLMPLAQAFTAPRQSKPQQASQRLERTAAATTNSHSPRRAARRRASLGDSSSSSSGMHMALPLSKQYQPLGTAATGANNNWSLKKIVGHHRLSLLQKRQQQEQMCQEFFGS